MPQRLTPEQLLTKYEQSSRRGKLTIFLGAAAGVGKTYTMLQAIPGLLEEGIDVVIGFIETHQRNATQALISTDLKVIPLRQIEYKGHTLSEVDLDAILARRPQLVILDELAHTNAAGSRNNKRYQDVVELIAAGIDVYTALNIQHIESLNDIVEQITGIKVNETVPDSILEQAAEIKLIDVTPDELIERLSEGKIYPQQQVALALGNFFRKGNLTALREMALLKTASKVERQVQAYRIDKAIDQVWASHQQLLVVIEPGYSSEKVIRAAKSMADKGVSKWFVAYVDNGSFDQKPIHEIQQVLSLLDFAKSLGAETVRLGGRNLSQVVVDYARAQNINNIVLSQYRLNWYGRLFGTTLLAKLAELAPELNLHLVHDEVAAGRGTVTPNGPKNSSAGVSFKLDYTKISQKIGYNCILFAGFGLLLYPLNHILNNENILMLYFMALIVLNHGRGKFSAVVAALAATISFDFFFIEPRLSFAISDIQYVITFIVMAGVGIAFSMVNGNLRFQLSELGQAQRQARLLFEASRQMAEAMLDSQAEASIIEFIPQLFNLPFALLLPSLAEELQLYPGSELAEDIDLNIAHWVFSRGQAAGRNTNTFAGSKYYYLPLNSQIRTRGVLVFLAENEVKFFLPATQDLLANFSRTIAMTLERIHFTKVAIQTEVLLAKQRNASDEI